MTRRSGRLAWIAASALALAAPTIVAAPAAAACDPLTPPTFAGAVPSPEDVLGFPIGTQEVTAGQIHSYLDAVDDATARVATAKAATSVQGRAIRYAVVGTADRATPTALAQLSDDLDALRDPLLPENEAAALAASTPRLLWLAGNVHGGEESGADASLQILYELADRTDCAARGIRDGAVVVIMPTQNPDGRQLDTRRNAYGFDMNRDWFARTQPETDGKIEVLRRYPPMLFIDEHEFGLSPYLFPPHADPEYHETPDTVHRWIFDRYGPAMEAAFDREGLPFWHGPPYDFFSTLFGDTVPAVGFHAAGMTFEKENGDPIGDRVHEQRLSAWTSLYTGATDPGLVADWHASYVEAYQEGVDGLLEPNDVYNEGSTLVRQVPDVPVRHYFFMDRAGSKSQTRELARRLQRMDVDVYRLTRPLPDVATIGYTTKGSDEFGIVQTLPAGTWWIPMAQGQKHWIQSMLQVDPWMAVEVTYDVTAWSNPLLMNVPAVWSPQELEPAARLVPPLDPPAAPALPRNLPNVGILENVRSTRGFEAAGHLRWLFDTRWHLPYDDVTPTDVRAGLPGVDVLLMPDGYANYLLQDLGAKGKAALRDWVEGGGRLIAWEGGAQVAVQAGVSTITLNASRTNMPGSLVQVALDASSPLADGIGRDVWVMYRDDDVLDPGLGASVAEVPSAPMPPVVSGLDEGASRLAGSTVVTDEAVGQGRVIAFSIDPNFRGWTTGTQEILWNAILGPDPSVQAGARLGSESRADAIRAAKGAARALPRVGSSPLRVAVASEDARVAASVIRAWSARAVRMPLRHGVLFLVANLRDLSNEEHRFTELLLRIEAAGVGVRWASVP